MHSASRHLDPLQADLYNGSAALPTLDPERAPLAVAWAVLSRTFSGGASWNNETVAVQLFSRAQPGHITRWSPVISRTFLNYHQQ